MAEEKESEEQYYTDEEWGDILFAKEMAIRDFAEKKLDKDDGFGIIVPVSEKNTPFVMRQYGSKW